VVFSAGTALRSLLTDAINQGYEEGFYKALKSEITWKFVAYALCHDDCTLLCFIAGTGKADACQSEG
jgi:hypothetical protein